MSDDTASQRDKRRQTFEANKSKAPINVGALKKWAWPLGLFLLIGGIVTAMIVTDNAAGECPGHWHNAQTVWIDGEQVQFTNPAFYAHSGNTYAPGTHMHGNDGIYHWHPAVEKCNAFEEGLGFVGVEVSKDALVLSDAHGSKAGTYSDAPVRMFQQKWSEQDDAWVEVTNFDKVLSKQPANGDGFVIMYGTYTDAEVDALLAQSTTMKGNPSYDPHYQQPAT